MIQVTPQMRILVAVEPADFRKGIDGKTKKWVSKYGSVSFDTAGRGFAWSGMNEAGLVMSTMSLYETELPPADQRPVLDSGNWIQYLLDTCATVEEVLAAWADFNGYGEGPLSEQHDAAAPVLLEERAEPAGQIAADERFIRCKLSDGPGRSRKQRPVSLALMRAHEHP